jgi:hypothetical protein
MPMYLSVGVLRSGGLGCTGLSTASVTRSQSGGLQKLRVAVLPLPVALTPESEQSWCSGQSMDERQATRAAGTHNPSAQSSAAAQALSPSHTFCSGWPSGAPEHISEQRPHVPELQARPRGQSFAVAHARGAESPQLGTDGSSKCSTSSASDRLQSSSGASTR